MVLSKGQPNTVRFDREGKCQNCRAIGNFVRCEAKITVYIENENPENFGPVIIECKGSHNCTPLTKEIPSDEVPKIFASIWIQ